jgi:N-acetylglutamate synthase/N-acetylornithine aminotransferase
MTIDDPTLSFENSQDIVINTIKSIISENENMIKIDSAKYTKMMLFILANLFASNHPIGSSARFSKNQD